MEFIKFVGLSIILIAYVPLSAFIKADPKGFSFTSFVLWDSLDLINMISSYIEGGEWYLPTIFIVCGSYCSFLLLKAKEVYWKKEDYFVSALIIVCLITYYNSGEIGAIVASTIAVVLAGIPQAIKNWNFPKIKFATYWGLFSIGSLFIFFSGEGWDTESFIKTRFFAIGNVFLGLGITAILLYRATKLKKSANC